VEQAPNRLVASLERAVWQAVESLDPVRRAHLRAAGLATQRSSIVCWNRVTGEPLSQVLSWQDLRGESWLRSQSFDDAWLHRTTGLFASAHYGASKFRWCLDQLPAVQQAYREGVLAMGPLASFLLFRLAAQRPFLVDPVNASRTLLFNLDQSSWDEPLLKRFGLLRNLLPQVVPNTYDYGDLVVAGRRIPLRVVIGDQSAAVFAAGVPDLDLVYVNVGTGAFAIRPLRGTPCFADGVLTSVLAHLDAPMYALEGTVNGAVSAIDWAKEKLGAKRVGTRLAGWLTHIDSPPLFLNGIGGLGSPYWQANFKSRFVGRGGLEAKFVAVVESVVFLLQRNLDAMRLVVDTPRGLRLTGGFAVFDAFCRRLADLSGLSVHRPVQHEATALGTAWLAAGSLETCAEQEDAGDTFAPEDNKGLRDRYLAWCEQMGPTCGEAMPRT